MDTAGFRRIAKALTARAATVWTELRSLVGDDAYERYLAHWQSAHSEEGGGPLSREAYFKAELERRWNGIKRCC